MNEMDLLRSIGHTDEALLAERPRRRRWLPWVSGLAACICLATILALTLPMDGHDETATADQTSTASDIHVQELPDTPPSASDIGLFWDDFQRMSVGELEAYYGTPLRPAWVPDDLQGGSLDRNGIFVRPDADTPYYDQNTLTYQDAVEDESQLAQYAANADAALSQGRSLTVTAAKENDVFYDTVVQSMEDARTAGELSTIHGSEVLVYHYTEFGADYFGARYRAGQTEVEVVGKNLTQEEFIRILEGLL